MVDVPALKVKLAFVATQLVVAPPPVIVQVLDPKLKEQALPEFDKKLNAVTLKFDGLAKVPCESVKSKLHANASASVTVMPAPSTVAPPRVLPALVRVADARNVGSRVVYAPAPAPDARVKSPQAL